MTDDFEQRRSAASRSLSDKANDEPTRIRHRDGLIVSVLVAGYRRSVFTEMGLLTDPSVGHGALTSVFVRYHNRFCILMYVASVALFCMLAHDSFSSREWTAKCLSDEHIRLTMNVCCRRFFRDLLFRERSSPRTGQRSAE